MYYIGSPVAVFITILINKDEEESELKLMTPENVFNIRSFTQMCCVCVYWPQSGCRNRSKMQH